MEYTEIYGLKKPDQDDYYNVEDFNDNADIIETELNDRLSVSEGGRVSGATDFTGDVNFIGGVYRNDAELSELYADKNHTHAPDTAVVAAAAYLSDEEYKERADYVSKTKTGDKAALIEAIAACPEGGIVELLPGEYVITGSQAMADTLGVEITKSIVLRGISASKVVVRQEGEIVDPAVLFTVKTENVSIEDMTLRMQIDSNNSPVPLIEINSDGASVRRCIFEAEEGITAVNDSISFNIDINVTNINPDDSSSYLIKEARIEDCNFKVPYSDLNTEEEYYCEIGIENKLKLSGRIYGNISSANIILFSRSFDEISYNGDLAVFGNGLLKSGGYDGEEAGSYGLLYS